MTRGWPLVAGLVVLLVGSSAAVRGGAGPPAGVGVPGLLFPDVESAAEEGGEDLAARAERELAHFLAGEIATDSLVLTAAEVGAMARHRLRGRLPAGVSDLRVELRGPVAAVSARLRFDRLEVGGNASRRLSQFLGDSARVAVEVEPSVVAPGRGRLTVRGLRAAGFSLPSGLVPVVLEQLGVEAERDGGDPSLRVPLPPDLGSVSVGDGRVVVRRRGGW